MSKTLNQFLHEHAEKNQAGKTAVAEWRSAVERLFSRIRGWLKEADPDGVMQIEQTEQEVNEPGIGRYRVPHLGLGVLGQWIEIVPKARQVRGVANPNRQSANENERASGRVDITDMVRKYFLYRFGEGDKEEWFIEGPSGDPTFSVFAKPQPKPLNKEEFENALMRCLR